MLSGAMENMFGEIAVSRVASISLLILTPPRTSWSARLETPQCSADGFLASVAKVHMA